MNRTINILLTVAFILVGCKGPSSLEPDVLKSEDYPIAFEVSCDLSVETKAVINTPTSFVALGGLTTADGNTYSVFGTNGTEVSPTNNAWTYSPIRYWQPGSYVFAGVVMPSTLSCTASLAENNHNQLTLDFGDGGFNLAETQTDLLVAFDAVSVQSTASAGPVDLDFTHQFAWIVIQGASVDPNTKGIQIQSVKVYGNTKSTAGNMVFTYGPTGFSSSYTLSSAKTNLNDPYKTLYTPSEENLPANGDWTLVKLGSNGLVYDTIVPELLVFPEQCTFSIAITYLEDGISKTRVGSLSAVWEAGKKYTYSFNLATDISFSVNVSDWDTADVNKDTPIEIV